MDLLCSYMYNLNTFCPSDNLSYAITLFSNTRVPLLPRQPPPEPTEDKGGKKKGGGGVQSPQPPVEEITNLELDYQLVVHAYNTATALVFHLVLSELKVLEVAIRDLSKPPSAKPVVEGEKPPEATKEDKSAKGKKGKVVCVAYSCTVICDFFYFFYAKILINRNLYIK